MKVLNRMRVSSHNRVTSVKGPLTASTNNTIAPIVGRVFSQNKYVNKQVSTQHVGKKGVITKIVTRTSI